MSWVLVKLRGLWAGWRRLARPGLLARLSRGRGGRAALIMIGIFLIPVAACWLIWAIGLIPIFEYARWIPIGLVTIVGIAGTLGLFLIFGFWGTAASGGRDGGDRLTDFTPTVGFGLGWLRWFMQLVLVAGCLYAWVAVFTDLQVWRLTSTPEIEALPRQVASMPIGADWKPTGSEKADDGGNPYPNGSFEQDYDVPAGFTYAKMTTWLSGPEWASGFGALRRPHCDSAANSCSADVIGKPRYVVYATWRRPAFADDGAHLDLKLEYTSYDPEGPDADVSEETVRRASLIPVPADWSRYVVTGETDDDGNEHYSQSFDVPEKFGRTDLESWINGPTWAHPTGGPAFGALTTEPCRAEPVSGDDLCTATVTSTRRTDVEADPTGPVEVIQASYRPKDHTVQVTLDRNDP